MKETDDSLQRQGRREGVSGFLEKGSGIDRHVTGIRVDANETVATGHVMRCITIAKQLVLLGERVLFFTADEYAAGLLGQAGMEYVCLHTSWNRMEEETDILRAKLRESGCGKLLVDSYQATAEYFKELKEVCKIIYIDDCFEAVYPVDMVINYNAYHVRFPYRKAYEGKARLLLGTAYVPLREEFAHDGIERESGGLQEEQCREKSGNAIDIRGDCDKSGNTDIGKFQVLISSGGGDLCNALPGILTEAMEDASLSQVVFHTVVGGFNRNVEELERIAQEYENVRLHYQVSHMAKLMRACTAAVSAAGTMLFELSAMQVPTVFFVSADNQQYDREFFAKEGRMLFAGDIREDREECVGNICSQLKEILGDKSMRRSMRRKLHEVTDGRGAQRVAREIVCL